MTQTHNVDKKRTLLIDKHTTAVFIDDPDLIRLVNSPPPYDDKVTLHN